MNLIRKIERLIWSPSLICDKKTGICLDVRVTPSLWIEGQYNEIRHRYMMWRKKKNLDIKDWWFKGIIR